MQDNLLVSALGKGRDVTPSLTFDDTPSRTLEVSHSEIPGLADLKPGEHVTVSVQAHLSRHGDGSSTLQVHHVAPDDGNDTEEPSEQEPIRVVPPESPVPG